MTLWTLGLVLIWVGTGGALGLLLYRFVRGAWSLEDEDVPPVSPWHKGFAALAFATAAGGVGLVIWSIG